MTVHVTIGLNNIWFPIGGIGPLQGNQPSISQLRYDELRAEKRGFYLPHPSSPS